MLWMLIFIFPIVVDFVAGSAVGAGHSVTVQPDGGLLVDVHPWGHFTLLFCTFGSIILPGRFHSICQLLNGSLTERCFVLSPDPICDTYFQPATRSVIVVVWVFIVTLTAFACRIRPFCIWSKTLGCG